MLGVAISTSAVRSRSTRHVIVPAARRTRYRRFSISASRNSPPSASRAKLLASNCTSVRDPMPVSTRSWLSSGALMAAATHSFVSPRRTETSPEIRLRRATPRPWSWPSSWAPAPPVVRTAATRAGSNLRNMCSSSRPAVLHLADHLLTPMLSIARFPAPLVHFHHPRRPVVLSG